MSNILMWHNYENSGKVRYHLKGTGNITLCNLQGDEPGHWSVGTNAPPTIQTACTACCGLAEGLIRSDDPSMVMIIKGFSNKLKQIKVKDRNCSPFEMIEEINSAAVNLLERIDKEEDMTKDLETFRDTIKKSKTWILNELFASTCCLPYNMGKK